MLKIGNLKLKSRLILAPMAGITDFPFRMLNRKFGCELAFVEMINCRSISHKSKKTHQMLASSSKDRPLGIQLLGVEPCFILKALEAINKNYDFDILDFNAACPVKKVIRRGEGVSLMNEPRKLQKLLELIVKNSKVPVTVKIRTGWDKNSLNAKEVALAAQGAGVSALFIHGRTKAQGYSPGVDYQSIATVKKSLEIPVIASGDILSAQLTKKMFDETGSDAVAVARGCLGNPWIFKEIEEFLKKGKIIKRPGLEDIVKVAFNHLDSYIDFYGEKAAVIKFRKFFSCYTRGLRHIRPLREKFSQAKTRKDVVAVISKICPGLADR